MKKQVDITRLHIVRSPEKGLTKEERIKGRIVSTEWFDDTSKWDEKKFIKETSEFLFETYGMDHKFDGHLLCMLADQISIYVKAKAGMKDQEIIAQFNGGKTWGANPYFAVMKETMIIILKLMNDLGLTPKARSNRKIEKKSDYSKLLNGVKGNEI